MNDQLITSSIAHCRDIVQQIILNVDAQSFEERRGLRLYVTFFYLDLKASFYILIEIDSAVRQMVTGIIGCHCKMKLRNSQGCHGSIG